MTAWRMWVALWDRREDAAALALVRRRQRRNTLKGRLLDLTAKVRSKL